MEQVSVNWLIATVDKFRLRRVWSKIIKGILFDKPISWRINFDGKFFWGMKINSFTNCFWWKNFPEATLSSKLVLVGKWEAHSLCRTFDLSLLIMLKLDLTAWITSPLILPMIYNIKKVLEIWWGLAWFAEWYTTSKKLLEIWRGLAWFAEWVQWYFICYFIFPLNAVGNMSRWNSESMQRFNEQ